MKNDRYQKICRHCWISFTVLTFFAFLPSACKKKEALPDEIQKLGRATGPVSQKPQMGTPQSPAGRAAKIHQGLAKEAIAVSRYTYIRIQDKSGKEIWAAVPQTKIEVGSPVKVIESIVMRDFKSPGLGRTFPLIIFGVLAEGGEGDAGTGQMPPQAQQLPPGKLPPGKLPPGKLPPGHPPIDKGN